ncbi:N/A [soil metagenome]
MERVNEAPPTRTEDQSPPRPGAKQAAAGRKERSRASRLTELPVLVLLAFVIAVVIKTFVVQAFFIPSESMLPTLKTGDRVLVEKLGYHLGSPEVGDVIVFERASGLPEPDLPWYDDTRNFLRELIGLPTAYGAQDYIKRVVATGGDTFKYAGNPRRLTVNGRAVPQGFVLGGSDRVSKVVTSRDCRNLGMKPAAGGCSVPQGSLFVMGDNRSNSEDSRFIGVVPEDAVVGRAFVIVWPLADLSAL